MGFRQKRIREEERAGALSFRHRRVPDSFFAEDRFVRAQEYPDQPLLLILRGGRFSLSLVILLIVYGLLIWAI